MNLAVENLNTVTVIHLSGKLILEETEDFEAAFLNVLEKNSKAVAIHCKQLDFIDSSGIGVFIKCLNHTKKAASVLHLVDINQNILNILRLAKLDLFFSILNEKDFNAKYRTDDMDDFINRL